MIKGCIFYENSDVPLRNGIIGSRRPVVVVSRRIYGNIVHVVPLTTSEQRLKDSEIRSFHVPVDVNGRQSVALCEQIRTVNLEELSRSPRGVCTAGEIAAIDAALAEILFEGEIVYEKQEK